MIEGYKESNSRATLDLCFGVFYFLNNGYVYCPIELKFGEHIDISIILVYVELEELYFHLLLQIHFKK